MDAAVMEPSTAAVVASVVVHPNATNTANHSTNSSSSSSSSSGYGSATTTPTNPASVGSNSSHYDLTSSSSTPVGTVDPMPVATVAPVAPYYSDSYVESYQRSSSSAASAYYQPTATYPGQSQYSSYETSFMGSNYGVERSSNIRHTSGLNTGYSSAEKLTNSNVKLLPHQQQHQQQLTPQQSSIGSGVNVAYSKQLSTSSSSSIATSKPQAAATPFFAQPLHSNSQLSSSSMGYYDPYKYNMPAAAKLPPPSSHGHSLSHGHSVDYMNYGSHLTNVGANSTYQHQPYYAAPPKSLQDVTYPASMKPLPPVPPAGAASRQQQPPNAPSYMSAGNGTAAYYDKYDKYAMYTPTAAPGVASAPLNSMTYPAQPSPSTANHHGHPPQYLPAEVTSESYRKAPSWPWSMEYPASNCRSLPPPPPHNSIPTAAVPPTNATYLPPQASSPRDIYYPSHEKYAASKYDKYNSYYQHQAYMSATRNAWPTGPPPHSHLGPPLGERLPQLSHHSLPSHMSGAPNPRQTYCTQAYQQQSCYYPPRPPHLLPSNSYPQTHLGSSANSNNGSPKCGGMYDYAPHANSKAKSSNDLYMAYADATPSHLNYNYASAAGAGQHYVSGTPGTAATHQPLNATIAPTQLHTELPTAYYNDLSLQTTYDNYASAAQQQQYTQMTSSQQQQQQQQYHNMMASRPAPTSVPVAETAHQIYATHAGKPASLLEYRKPKAVSMPDAGDCYVAQSTTQLTNLDEHTAASRGGYGSYELAVNALYAERSGDDVENAEKAAANTKNLSLRDFLSSWNEDEEEYASVATAEELNFMENESQVTESAVALLQSGEETAAYKGNLSNMTQQQQPLLDNHLQFKGSFSTRPKIHVGITVDSTVDVETNQYINLPDIIIDIEKANNVSVKEEEIRDISLAGFDVEKELDELQNNKTKVPVIDTTPTPNPVRTESVITQKVEPLKEPPIESNESPEPEVIPKTVQEVLLPEAEKPLASEVVLSDIANNHKTASPDDSLTTADVALALSSIQADNSSCSAHSNAAYFNKDTTIDSDNNSHSNESTFEKEYKTFIDKIGSDSDVEMPPQTNNNLNINEEAQPPLADDVKQSAEKEREFARNIKEFSKFYKRKRKLSETLKEERYKKPHLEANFSFAKEPHKSNQNFPQAYTKKCRKRKPPVIKAEKRKLNGNSLTRVVKPTNFKAKGGQGKVPLFHCRILHSLRRFRFCKIKLDTSMLVQRHIATLRERRLPLIKRQSVMKYTSERNVACYNPKSLKCLSVNMVNTETFRKGLLQDIEARQKAGECKKDCEVKTNIKSVEASEAIECEVIEQVAIANGNENQIENESHDKEMPLKETMRGEIPIEEQTTSNQQLIESAKAEENIERCADTEELETPCDVTKEVDEYKVKATDVEIEVFEDGHDEEESSETVIKSDVNLMEACESEESEQAMKDEDHDPAIESSLDYTKNTEFIDESKPLESAPLTPEPLDSLSLDAPMTSNLELTQHKTNSSVISQQSGATKLTQISTETFYGFDEAENEMLSVYNDNAMDVSCADEVPPVPKNEIKFTPAANGADDNCSQSSMTSSSSSDSSDSRSSSSSDNTDSDDSTSSSSSSSSSEDEAISLAEEKVDDFNEMEALEKEMSQHRLETEEEEEREGVDESSRLAGTELAREENVKDIANLKKMLESDSDEHEECSHVDKESEQGQESGEVEGMKVADRGADSAVGDEAKVKEAISVIDEAAPEPTVELQTGGDHVASLKTLAKTCLELNGLSTTTEIPIDDDQIDQNEVAVGIELIPPSIPKLSDLCKIALSSSFENSTTTPTTPNPNTEIVERELSVEEALAEMYRQAGVTSDPEYDDLEERETQDVLLINLEEILVNDSDLYVLQCDMNENVLSVVAQANTSDPSGADADSVETLQLMEVLNANESEVLAIATAEVDDLGENITTAITETETALTEDTGHTHTFDLPAIHHEEIVPDNYKPCEKRKFIKYLHEKYVQKNITKFYHANRVLKKYKRQLSKKFEQNVKGLRA